jgi:hypothetical protein
VDPRLGGERAQQDVRALLRREPADEAEPHLPGADAERAPRGRAGPVDGGGVRDAHAVPDDAHAGRVEADLGDEGRRLLGADGEERGGDVPERALERELHAPERRSGVVPARAVRRVQRGRPERGAENAADDARLRAVQVEEVGTKRAYLAQEPDRGTRVAAAEPAVEREAADAAAARDEPADEAPGLRRHPARREDERDLPARAVEALARALEVRQHAVLHRLAHDEDAACHHDVEPTAGAASWRQATTRARRTG